MPYPDRSGRRRTARPRLEQLEPRELLATFTVTDGGDSGPGTLRDAITRADLDTGQDFITFAPGLTGSIFLKSALPDLTSHVAIFGPGSSQLKVTRDPSVVQPDGPGFRIFTVDAGAVAGISNLTVAGGGGLFYGGGIANAGTLIVVRCSIVFNTLTNNAPGTFFNGGPAGGAGIYNSGTLQVVDSLVAGNLAPNFGTIGFPSSLAPVTDGGGIANVGTAFIAGSTISGNAAASGGGLVNSGALTLLNDTVGGNQALSPFTAGPSGALGGGGIANRGGLLTVVFTTITANLMTAGTPLIPDGYGGGIASAADRRTGIPGRVLLLDTIVAGNSRSYLPSDYAGDAPPAGAANLIGVQTDLAGKRTGGARRPLDVRLGPPDANGGPTPTYALLPGSPAIDRGIPLPGITTDQRGVRRPQGRRPDIGAFEFQGRSR